MALSAQQIATLPFGRNSLITDSGCNEHTFNHASWFTRITPLANPRDDQLSASGHNMMCIGVGTVELRFASGHTLTLSNVRLVPTAPVNMISQHLLKVKGLLVDNYDDVLIDRASRIILCPVTWPHGLAMIKAINSPHAHNLAALPAPQTSRPIPFELMHKRLGHASKSAIKALCKAHNVRITPGSDADFHCEACHLAKADSLISHMPAPRALRFLIQVHWDFVSMQPTGINGENYLLHGIDA